MTDIISKKTPDSPSESKPAVPTLTVEALKNLKNDTLWLYKKLWDANRQVKSPDKFNKTTYETLINQGKEGINTLWNSIDQQSAQITDSSSEDLKTLLAELKSEHNKLVSWFKELKKPESLNKTKEPYSIQNWPKSAFMDIELSIDKIKEISVKELIATNWKTKYFIVEVPSHWTQVLRINDWDDGDEIALLDITEIRKENDNEDDFREKVYNRIDAAEITRAWDAFRDIEVDGVNIYNSGTDALWEWILTWLGAWSLTAWWIIGLSTLKASAWTVATVLGFCKIIATWATLTTWVIAWTAAWAAVVAWWAVAAFTDVDLTTERARKYWLKAKLDNIDNLTPKSKSEA